MPEEEFGAYFRDYNRDELGINGPSFHVAVTLPGKTDWIQLPALIDTGSSASAIIKAVLDQLGSKPIGQSTLSSVNSSAICGVHKVTIDLLTSGIVLNDWVVCEVATMSYPVILGRDFLKHAVFVYDGGGNIAILMLPENILKAGYKEKYTLVSDALLKGWHGVEEFRKKEKQRLQ